MRHAEGRLEADGTLACSYHGWRFGPDGKCTAIPQVGLCYTREVLMRLVCHASSELCGGGAGS